MPTDPTVSTSTRASSSSIHTSMPSTALHRPVQLRRVQGSLILTHDACTFHPDPPTKDNNANDNARASSVEWPYHIMDKLLVNDPNHSHKALLRVTTRTPTLSKIQAHTLQFESRAAMDACKVHWKQRMRNAQTNRNPQQPTATTNIDTVPPSSRHWTFQQRFKRSLLEELEARIGPPPAATPQRNLTTDTSTSRHRHSQSQSIKKEPQPGPAENIHEKHEPPPPQQQQQQQQKQKQQHDDDDDDDDDEQSLQTSHIQKQQAPTGGGGTVLSEADDLDDSGWSEDENDKQQQQQQQHDEEESESGWSEDNEEEPVAEEEEEEEEDEFDSESYMDPPTTVQLDSAFNTRHSTLGPGHPIEDMMDNDDDDDDSDESFEEDQEEEQQEYHYDMIQAEAVPLEAAVSYDHITTTKPPNNTVMTQRATNPQSPSQRGSNRSSGCCTVLAGSTAGIVLVVGCCCLMICLAIVLLVYFLAIAPAVAATTAVAEEFYNVNDAINDAWNVTGTRQLVQQFLRGGVPDYY